MDAKKIRRDLRRAEEHVRIGEAELEKQRGIVATLQRDGHDPRMARQLLQTFEALQASHIAGCGIFARELAIAEEEERKKSIGRGR